MLKHRSEGELVHIKSESLNSVFLQLQFLFILSSLPFTSLCSDPDVADQGQVLVVVTASVGGFSLLVILTLFLLITGRWDFLFKLACQHWAAHADAHKHIFPTYNLQSNATTWNLLMDSFFLPPSRQSYFPIGWINFLPNYPACNACTSSLLRSINLQKFARSVVFKSPWVNRVLSFSHVFKTKTLKNDQEIQIICLNLTVIGAVGII